MHRQDNGGTSRTYKTWTTKELVYLKENYSRMPAKLIARKLNRTIRSITSRANLLGLKGYRKHYAFYRGENLITIGTIKSISQETGIKEVTLRSYKSPSTQSTRQASLVDIEEV